MNRPTQLLERLSFAIVVHGSVTIYRSDMNRIMRYVAYLEDSAKSAEAYAAKHADMYIEERNRRAKEDIHS